MPDADRHLACADKNKRLATNFASKFAQQPDWAVVIRFYAALHMVDAYLATKTVSVQHHSGRHSFIRSFPELSAGRGRSFRARYKWLQDTSEQVRYDPGYVLPDSALQDSEAKLSQVESFIVPKIRQTGPH